MNKATTEPKPKIQVIVRPYRQSDASKVVDVYRDGYDSLRVSRGGQREDRLVDEVQQLSDDALLDRITRGYHLFVAQVETSGEILGIGAISDRWLDRVLRSARSKHHYIRSGVQGLHVGTLIRREGLARARALGYRKVWGYSHPETSGWHLKFGATFHPGHDTFIPDHQSDVHYYEIVLRPSLLNRLRIEPWLFRIAKRLRMLKHRFHAGPGAG